MTLGLFWSNLGRDKDCVAILLVYMCDKPNREAESSFGDDAATGRPNTTSDSSVIGLFSCSNWLGCAKSASPCNILRLKFGVCHAQQIQEASDLFKQEYSRVVMRIQSLWYHRQHVSHLTACCPHLHANRHIWHGYFGGRGPGLVSRSPPRRSKMVHRYSIIPKHNDVPSPALYTGARPIIFTIFVIFT